MRPALFIFAAFALIGCGQQTQTAEAPASASHPARDPNAPPPVPMQQATGGPCAAGRASAAVRLESYGVAAGHTITATPRALACSEPGPEGRTECSVTGPAEIQVSGPNSAAFALQAGQSAILVVGAAGAQCHLDANGE